MRGKGIGGRWREGRGGKRKEERERWWGAGKKENKKGLPTPMKVVVDGRVRRKKKKNGKFCCLCLGI